MHATKPCSHASNLCKTNAARNQTTKAGGKEPMKKEELGELILASQDAIQEAIGKAFSKRDTLKKDAYAKTWLMRILINECYGVMRREKRVVSLEDYRQEEKADKLRRIQGGSPENRPGCDCDARRRDHRRRCAALLQLESLSGCIWMPWSLGRPLPSMQPSRFPPISWVRCT